MNKLQLHIGVVLMLTFSTLCQAQIEQKTCSDLAQTVGVGYSTYLTREKLDAMNYYAKCESTVNSDKTGLNITYAGFGLGGDYSADTKTAQCASAKQALSIEDVEYARVKQVFKAGLDVVSQCLSLASRGWVIKTSNYKDAVSISIANTAPVGGVLNGIDVIGPSGTVKCSGMPASFPTKVGALGLSTLCTRTPNTQTIDGTTFTQAEDTFINLQGADGPIAIPMPGYKTSALGAITADVESLRKAASSIRADLAALTLGIKTSGPQTANPGGGYLNGEAAFCPDGSFMVSMRFRVDSGGPHGIVSQVQPICRAVTK